MTADRKNRERGAPVAKNTKHKKQMKKLDAAPGRLIGPLLVALATMLQPIILFGLQALGS